MKTPLIIAGIVASPVALYMAVGTGGLVSTGSTTSAFVVPSMSPEASEGKIDFAAECGQCHGNYGEGTSLGPPLMHPVYAPSSMTDDSIAKVIEHGAAARRWPFGDMPGIADLDPRKVNNIIRFLREMQNANDIR